MRISADGNIGIGATPTSSYKLLVNGDICASGGHLHVTGSSSTASGQSLYAPASNTMAFSTNSVEAMRISADGSVGIGGTPTTEKLEVYGNTLLEGASPTLNINATSGAGTINVKESGTVRCQQAYDSGNDLYYIYATSGKALTLGAGNAERMRISADGNIGISTDSPGAAMHIESTTPLRFTHPADSSQRLNLTIDTSWNTWAGAGGNGHKFTTLAGGEVVIDTSGNLGVGTAVPMRKMDCAYSDSNTDLTSGAGSTDGRGLLILNSDGTDDTYAQLDLRTGSSGDVRLAAVDRGTGSTDLAILTDNAGSFTEKMRISADGSVGLGTDSPSVLLDLESTSPVIRFTDSDATETPECEVSGAGGDLTLRADRDNEKADSLIKFEVDGSEKVRIDSTGVGIGGTASQKLTVIDAAPTILNSSTAGDSRFYAYSDGGDAYMRMTTVSGVSNDWAVGTDRTDGYFKIADNSTLGTNDRLTIDASGVSTFTGQVISEDSFKLTANVSTPAGNAMFRPDSNTLAFATNSAERMRFGSAGQLGLGGANYGTADQVLTSNGASAAPTWEDAGGSGDMTGVDLTAGTGITIDSELNTTSGDYSATITCTVTDTNTTYTAGDGLDLTGTVFSAEAASLTNPGVVELATATETNTGTDATRAVTPDGLEDWTGSAQVTTLGTIGTGVWSGTAIADGKISSASTWNAKQDALTFGIADGAVAKCNDVVVDDDFLRINGTEIEGRSASQVLGDIGASASGHNHSGTYEPADADIAKTDVAQTFTKPQRCSVTTIAADPNYTPDFADGNNFTLSIASGYSSNLNNPDNPVVGQSGIITIYQTSGGSMSFSSHYKFVDGTAPSLASGECWNHLVYYVAKVDGSNTRIVAHLLRDTE